MIKSVYLNNDMDLKMISANLEPILLSSLPIVITGPGLYRLRGGGEARIHEVRNGPPEGFNAKGSKIVQFRGQMRPRGYNIWHVSGRLHAVGYSNGDIVERIGN